MTRTFAEFLEAVEAVSPEFAQAVRTHVLPKSEHSRLHLCSTNLVVEVDTHGGYSPFGCPICLGATPDQDEDGRPILAAQACLDAQQYGLKPSDLPTEVLLNLWFCPGCRIPLWSLVPRFE